MSTSDQIAAQAPGVARPQSRGTVWPTLRAIYIIWYRDILRFWRDRMRLIGSLAQPLLFLIVFGTGLSSAATRLNRPAARGSGNSAGWAP